MDAQCNIIYISHGGGPLPILGDRSHLKMEFLRDLEDWSGAPGARYCHPREEHLQPLHVCAAMAGSPARLIFDEYIAGKRSVAFHWNI